MFSNCIVDYRGNSADVVLTCSVWNTNLHIYIYTRSARMSQVQKRKWSKFSLIWFRKWANFLVWLRKWEDSCPPRSKSLIIMGDISHHRVDHRLIFHDYHHHHCHHHQFHDHHYHIGELWRVSQCDKWSVKPPTNSWVSLFQERFLWQNYKFQIKVFFCGQTYNFFHFSVEFEQTKMEASISKRIPIWRIVKNHTEKISSDIEVLEMGKEWITEHPLLCHCHHHPHNHNNWYHLFSSPFPLAVDYHIRHQDNHQNCEVLQSKREWIIYHLCGKRLSSPKEDFSLVREHHLCSLLSIFASSSRNLTQSLSNSYFIV